MSDSDDILIGRVLSRREVLVLLAPGGAAAFAADESVTDGVHALAPYSQRGQRDVRNEQDGIFRQGGDELLLALTGSPEQGYVATFPIGVQV